MRCRSALSSCSCFAWNLACALSMVCSRSCLARLASSPSSASARTLTFCASAYSPCFASTSSIRRRSRSSLDCFCFFCGSAARFFWNSVMSSSCRWRIASSSSTARSSYSFIFRSHIVLNCWNSSMCASSIPRRCAICRERSDSCRRSSSCWRSSSSRFLAISASTYLPCRSQFFLYSSSTCRKSCTADASFSMAPQRSRRRRRVSAGASRLC
mmetsp:Transcript_12570/g.32927  ORF Transcript_12570/g.32927 Transcript_12570/m.32927 type:complete len:213 (+) Transcript_12570:607-1245(+)